MKKIILFKIFFAIAILMVCVLGTYTQIQAVTTCGTTGMLSRQLVGSGLVFSEVSNTVADNTLNTLTFTVRNTASVTKTITIIKANCRCQEHLGYPFRTGIGQCQYYWSPGASQTNPACQTFSEDIVLTPNETKSIQISVSQYQNNFCGSFQLDFFLDKIDGVPFGLTLDDKIFGASFTDLCQNCTLTPPVSVSCSPSSSSVNTGQTIIWQANVTGGNGAGSYTYSWSGTDGLTSTLSSVGKSYSTAGTKYATVAVTSGGQSQTANCSAVVNQLIPPLAVSCSVSPNSINTGNSATFTSNAFGGTGSYTYLWSGACTGTSSNCSNTFNTQGAQTATVSVTSGSQTQTANCSVTVANNPISVSCYASPSSVNSGQTATFYSNASGGTGSYTYSWSGACTGTSSNCSNTMSGQGSQYATVTVTSGGQFNSATCSVSVNQSCTPNHHQICVGNSLYWYDSCNNQGSYIGTCGTINYTTLSVTKQVRNLTTSTQFANSVYASPNDTLMYMITLQASGNQAAQNVFVRDILPTNIIYDSQLVIACTGGNYNCNNYSGNITSGINLYTINAGQTYTITYQAKVSQASNFAYGTTTHTNTVSTTASNVSSIPNATASVFVTRTGVLGVTTIPTGLTNNVWLDSFVIPLLIALILVWMWRMGMFIGVEKWLDSKKKVKNGYKSEKELLSRVESLKKFGR